MIYIKKNFFLKKEIPHPLAIVFMSSYTSSSKQSPKSFFVSLYFCVLDILLSDQVLLLAA